MPAMLVLELLLLPSADDLPGATVDGPPIAVVPVDGVVLGVVPGVVGPASVLEVALAGEPVPVVPPMLLVVEPGVLLPSVVEPSACELVVLLPHGVDNGTPGLVCASAAAAHGRTQPLCQ